VNSICPGGIDTPMGRGDSEGFENIDSSAWYRSLPLQRIGKPEEVAKLALYLASSDSAYCTGAEFVIDGGALAGERFA
jgi:3alpha(or 20beta)-hydroxysteroid dehydrogenase